MKVKSRRFSSRARCSQKSTQGSAGHDLFLSRNVALEPNTTQRIPIDIGFCFFEQIFCKNRADVRAVITFNRMQRWCNRFRF